MPADLQITPERIAAIYDCLRAFPPFCRWRLPPSDEIEIRIGVQQDAFAHYHRERGEHAFEVSMLLVRDFDTLVQTVAHEMIHLHQARAGTETKAEHNREWHRLAAIVCRRFGWTTEGF